MYIESIVLSGFRCFGPEATRVALASGPTAFIGGNGSGKTAVMLALTRLFGVGVGQRRIRREDFHVPAAEDSIPSSRSLFIEVVLAFPELDSDEGGEDTVPEFFHQMGTTKNGVLKCRLRLDATWTSDGSLDGDIEDNLTAIRTLSTPFTEEDCLEVHGADRGRIQFIYVPAIRDPSAQLSAFLRGRLWRAVEWSSKLEESISTNAEALNGSFLEEKAVKAISSALQKRWSDIDAAGTKATPVFRAVDVDLGRFVRNVDIQFEPYSHMMELAGC